MKTFDREYTIAGRPPRVIDTNAVTEQSLASSATEEQKRSEEWQRFVDCPLINWGCDPSLLEDDGVTPPTQAIVAQACQVALTLFRNGWLPPTQVVPNGEGGIVFERFGGPFYEAIEISSDGAVELSAFEDAKLVYRQPLAVDFS